MKAFKTLLLLLALGLSVYGQAVNVTANKLKGSATAPSGACSAQQVQLTTAGVVYVCASGTWTSSGGGTTINSTNGQVPYRVNSTTFGDSAISSNALSATGISVTSAAAGSGVTISTTSSGTNEDMTLSPKGTGAINFTGAMKGPNGSASTPTYGFTNVSGGGFYFGGTAGRFILAAGGSAQLEFGGALVTAGSSLHYGWASYSSPSGANPDTSWTRFGAAVIRAANGSTGAGQLILGTSTDTADAQLSVYSQSTTRPSLKLRALSGTAGTQNVLESYDAGGSNTFSVRADGRVIALAFDLGGSFGVTGSTWGSTNGLSATTFVKIGSSGSFSFNDDTYLYRDAANTLAQRNSTNAQAFRLYETYTDGSNYERLEINASATTNTIKPAAAGTGTASKIDYYLTPTVFISSGTGSPEGVVTAGIGSMYARTDGGAGTSFYVKESGTGNTGWVAK